MHRNDGGDRLDLEDDRQFDEQIQPVAAVEGELSILDRNLHVDIDSQARMPEFGNQACSICRLQQSRTQSAVHRDRALDDLSGESIERW